MGTMRVVERVGPSSSSLTGPLRRRLFIKHTWSARVRSSRATTEVLRPAIFRRGLADVPDMDCLKCERT